MPAELISSVQAPGIGSSTSITAPKAWLIASQSATVIAAPSARSAMICTVGPVAAEHGDAHELVAHAFERGRDDGGQPGFQAGMLRFRCVQKQKRRPVKATPRNTAENDLCRTNSGVRGHLQGAVRICATINGATILVPARTYEEDKCQANSAASVAAL